MYNDKLKYNEIWDKSNPSNKFNYHLMKLVEEKILIKEDEFYKLTSKGLEIISGLDGVEILQKSKPLVCCFVMGFKDDKVLVNIRKKQPFMDYLGIPGGKLDFGNTTIEQAKKEFLEETGLSGDLSLKLITNYITLNLDDCKVSHHMIGFFYRADNLKGELIEKNREGENSFITLNKALELNHFPDFPIFSKILLENKSEIKFQEAIRKIKDGKFTELDYTTSLQE